jgi:polyisoprenoid-binding protein YceI
LATAEATVAAARPAGAGASAAYVVISERSEAAYFADEQFAGLSLPSTAKGSTQAITGTFFLTDSGLDTEQTSSFTVDLTTLTSDESRRDRRVQNDGLQTSTYPTATFTVTSLDGYPEAFPEGEEVAFRMTGVMDLHGVQKELAWDVLARNEGNVFTALATVNFLYADFDIPVLNVAGFVSVEKT